MKLSDRLARVKRLAAEKVAAMSAESSAPTHPAQTTQRVVDAFVSNANDVLGPGAAIPAAMAALGRREERERLRAEVVRLSLEGVAPREIAARTGLEYGNVCKIRSIEKVSKARTRRS